MNILVINGSPKCGNSGTLKLTHAFLDGAGWSGAEVVDVAKAGVKSCLGCFACWNRTPGQCVMEDGMRGILAKIIAADVVIWSFPLYYFSVPGGLKNVIDRQLPLSMPFMDKDAENGGHKGRYDLSVQRHILISTCGFWTAGGNYDAVTAMFGHCFGTQGYEKIFCGQGELFGVPELKNRTGAYLEIVRRAGAEFVDGGISAATREALAEPLFARETFEKMADASWGIQENDNNGGMATDDSLSFMKQMAALYQPDGVERVLEFDYTDIGKTYQILLTAQGGEILTDQFRSYTTKIETPYSVWRSISKGEISGAEAMFQHLYRVEGDFDLMLKFDQLFGGASAPETQTEKRRKGKSNMAVLLAPWIIVWMATDISLMIGGVLGVLAVAVLPLLWIRFRPVVFEQISAPIVAGLSLAALLGVEAQTVIPVSYLLFGLMWLAGSYVKIPLTAWYSSKHYGSESAFANPLFMQTNRILTAAWGGLYLVLAIVAFALMRTDWSSMIWMVTLSGPAFMGIFTGWFQKWYPARVARSCTRSITSPK